MKWIGWLAIAWGAKDLLAVLSFPFRMVDTLRKFGIPDADNTLLGHLASAWPQLTVSTIFALASIGAGVLMLKRRTFGSKLWKALCCFYLVSTAVLFFGHGQGLAEGLTMGWWFVVFVLTIYLSRKETAGATQASLPGR